MTIGETIQRLRKEKGWSQEDLAEQNPLGQYDAVLSIPGFFIPAILPPAGSVLGM